ncbi:hypothetical protein [Buttiauxella sp. BIGb0552]|nr:hypothetical protein [Buttiauxella sp. BIGb0552]
MDFPLGAGELHAPLRINFNGPVVINDRATVWVDVRLGTTCTAV